MRWIHLVGLVSCGVGTWGLPTLHNLLAWYYSRAGFSDAYPVVSWPELPKLDQPPAKSTDPFLNRLKEYVLFGPPYLLTVVAPNSEVWAVYKVEDLIGRKEMFRCRHVIYADFHRKFWGKDPYRLFLHLYAEWSQTVPDECFFLMSPAATEPPTDGFQYFGRYPAGLNLMYLLLSGVIESDTHDPFLLYLDTDIVMTRAGDGVAYILSQLRHANPITTEERLFRDHSGKVDLSKTSLIIATDPACAASENRWARMNTGTLLFRPLPLVAAIFEATYESWRFQRPHEYDRLDQAMLTLVLNETISFPHANVRALCRSDPRINGPADALWTDACEGREVLWRRPYIPHVPHRDMRTQSLLLKWGAEAGEVAMVCARMLGGGSIMNAPGVHSDIWTWHCGDIGMHMIGGTSMFKLTFTDSEWREAHVRNCSHLLPFRTLVDGQAFWKGEDTRASTLSHFFRGSDMTAMTMIDLEGSIKH